jgi:hypothetical protein
MSTQVLEKGQAASKRSRTAEQQERAAAFAAKARERAGAASTAGVTVSGSGTTTYNVTLRESTGGFAELGWGVSSSMGRSVITSEDWVGVFINERQAIDDPDGNNLDWEWAEDGNSYTTDVPLQGGYVAAYVIKNSSDDWVTVAVSAPYTK